MTFLKILLVSVVIGLIGGLLKHYLDPWSTEEKKKSPKKKKKSPWDDDPFFGTPLQKF